MLPPRKIETHHVPDEVSPFTYRAGRSEHEKHVAGLHGEFAKHMQSGEFSGAVSKLEEVIRLEQQFGTDPEAAEDSLQMLAGLLASAYRREEIEDLPDERKLGDRISRYVERQVAARIEKHQPIEAIKVLEKIAPLKTIDRFWQLELTKMAAIAHEALASYYNDPRSPHYHLPLARDAERHAQQAWQDAYREAEELGDGRASQFYQRIEQYRSPEEQIQDRRVSLLAAQELKVELDALLAEQKLEDARLYSVRLRRSGNYYEQLLGTRYLALIEVETGKDSVALELLDDAMELMKSDDNQGANYDRFVIEQDRARIHEQLADNAANETEHRLRLTAAKTCESRGRAYLQLCPEDTDSYLFDPSDLPVELANTGEILTDDFEALREFEDDS